MYRAAMATADVEMIAAAERIVAERGLAAMSLRAVQTESGQKNKSAAHYHFGDREGLVRAVVDARMGPIDDRRTDLLLGLGADATIRDLVVVLVHPLAEAVLTPDPSYWARFLVQAYSDPSIASAVADSVRGRSFVVATDRIEAQLAHLPAELRQWRIGHAVGLAVTGLAALERDDRHVDIGITAEQAVADLVEMCTAVLTAPTAATPDTTSLTAQGVSSC